MDRPGSIDQALRSAAPHELLDVVRREAAAQFGATGTDLLMADYSLTMLQPVSVLPHTTEPVPITGTDPGLAFLTQTRLTEPAEAGAVTVHLPVSVRGDRLGVLSVELPQHPSTGALAGLEHLASALGHEILVAERDTDVYLQARRARRLTLAAEMQWQLLPGRSCTRPEYRIGAQLEPAYAIHGDNFDWSTNVDHLTLTLANGMGEGIQAALLTNLGVNALRNARRAGASLPDQAMLADQAVYAQHRGVAHLATLLLRIELATGVAEVVDAGSPRIWLHRGDEIRLLTFDEQLPLGMFEDTQYYTETLTLLPADRLVIMSDGVYDVASPAGERYADRALIDAIRQTRSTPAAHLPRALLQRLAQHRDTADALDDAMVLCLDWHGR